MPISISTKTYWFASLQLLISTWHFNGFKAKKLKIRIVHAIRKFASHNNFQGFSLQKIEDETYINHHEIKYS